MPDVMQRLIYSYDLLIPIKEMTQLTACAISIFLLPHSLPVTKTFASYRLIFLNDGGNLLVGRT